MVNALSAGFPSLSKEELTAILQRLGHRADIRGERLNIAEFVALSDALSEAMNK